VNDLTLVTTKFNFKVELIEKPYFYTDGKTHRSSPFVGSEKAMLKEVSGDSLKDIIVDLNKQNPDKHTAIIYISKEGVIALNGKGDKVRIQCLIV